MAIMHKSICFEASCILGTNEIRPFSHFGYKTSSGDDEVVGMVDMTLNDKEDSSIIDVDTFVLEDFRVATKQPPVASTILMSFDATRVKPEPEI
jgi:hypothetical protein